MKNTKNALDQLKDLYSVSTVEKKDISLKDLVDKNGGDSVTLNITGIGSKYVPKFDNEKTGCKGFHTMLYLADGKKTGAFSNALHEFAAFFFRNVNLNPEAEFNRLTFSEGDNLEVKISRVKLDEGKTTYNFEILGGKLENNMKHLGGGADFCYLAAMSENEISLALDEATGELVEPPTLAN